MPCFLSKKASKIKPYAAGAQPSQDGVIKLNTNENPYPPSPKAIEAYKNFRPESLRLYPRPDGGELKKAAAALYGLREDNVFCGNGSDEVLALSFYAFFDGGIMFPDVTYSFYPVWAELFGISYKTLPVNDDFTIPADKLTGRGIVLANPNAPTGIALDLCEIESILKRNKDHVVLIDEAYSFFGAQSAAPLIEKYPNLLVVCTLSKAYSLAGLRAGFALGQPRLIEGLENVKDSFNSYPLDAVAQAVGSAALSDTAYYEEIAKKITATRDKTIKRLREMGFSVTDSKTNFIFAGKKGVDAADLKNFLEKNKIFVRHWDAPRISGYLRISVGTDEQMEILLSRIKEYISR